MAINRNRILYCLLVFVELSILAWVGIMIAGKLNNNPFGKNVTKMKGAQSF